MGTAFSSRDFHLLPPVVAHRGASRAAPENTVASFAAAAAMGARGIECDVRMSADGVSVLMHDESPERTTGRAGRIERMSGLDIECLDAGYRWGGRFAGEPVPTLAAALAACARLGLQPNLELKGSAGRESRLAAELADTIAAAWPDKRPLPLVSSFDAETLAAVAATAPGLPLGLLTRRWHPDLPRRARMLGAVSLHCRHERLDAGRCRVVKRHGLFLVAYTVNFPARARVLFLQGVDSIITDRPDAMKAVLAQARARDTLAF